MDAIPEDVIASLPRITIVRRDMPTSGLTYWNGEEWIIALNRSEPEARQRFSLFHEYKHIVDHGSAKLLYRGSRTRTAEQQAEQAADFFAGCVLMPRKLVKRAWAAGRQTPEQLGQFFDVSARAAEVRLAQLGLTEDRQRCATATYHPRSRRTQ
jgi:Zn-dependent peptidase ImmA (M78 family)